jgi:hypothetical protein
MKCACGHGSDFHNLELGKCYSCDVDCFFKAGAPCPTCGDERHRHEDPKGCIDSLRERLERANARAGV